MLWDDDKCLKKVLYDLIFLFIWLVSTFLATYSKHKLVFLCLYRLKASIIITNMKLDGFSLWRLKHPLERFSCIKLRFRNGSSSGWDIDTIQAPPGPICWIFITVCLLNVWIVAVSCNTTRFHTFVFQCFDSGGGLECRRSVGVQ